MTTFADYFPVPDYAATEQPKGTRVQFRQFGIEDSYLIQDLSSGNPSIPDIGQGFATFQGMTKIVNIDWYMRPVGMFIDVQYVFDLDRK